MLEIMDAPHSPAPFEQQRSRSVRRVLLLPAAFRAAHELALARLRHLTLTPPKIQELNRRAAMVGKQDFETQEQIVERVAYVIPRVAARLPWRADCLIQAMAAQRWLKAKGIATSISIGVHLPSGGGFAAHAWLKHGERIVTGDDISAFSPIFTADTP